LFPAVATVLVPAGDPAADQDLPLRVLARLRIVSTPLGDDNPDDRDKQHHRTPAEELEWIGAEVEARPKVMFWGTVAVAVILGLALVIFIVITLTGNP